MVKNILRDKDCLSGLVVLIFAIAGYVYSEVKISSVATVGVAPDFYPKLLFIVIGGCGAATLIQGIRREQKKNMPYFNWKPVLTTIGLLVGYAYLLQLTNFIISSILFMVAFMLVLGERKPLNLISVPVVTSLLIYFLFSKAFMIMLP